MKKIVLALLSLCMVLHADQAADIAYQEFKYQVGIELVDQPLITDWLSARQAMLKTYEKVEDLAQIVDLYLLIDDSLQMQGITTFHGLLDFYITSNEYVRNAVIVWLAAYQNLFLTFASIHNDSVSFDDWLFDLDQLAYMQIALYNGTHINYFDTNYIMLLDCYLIEMDALAGLEEVLGL